MVYKYVNGELQLESAPFGGGRIMVSEGSSGTAYTPNYYITDHLGSVRATVDGQTGAIASRNDYYPYGLKWNNPGALVSDNRWLYNGKEEQTTGNTGYYDWEARFYEPKLSRMLQHDPLSSVRPWESPYGYCGGNPVSRIDLKGEIWIDKKGRQIWENGQYTEHATANHKWVGDNLQRTPTGKALFDEFVNDPLGMTMEMDEVTMLYESVDDNGAAIYRQLNGLAQTEYSWDDKTETANLTKADIIIFKKNVETSAKNSGRSVDEQVAATAGHEIKHTRKENRQQAGEKEYLKRQHDLEKEPKEAARGILNEFDKINLEKFPY